jgi:Fe2+ transport system protein FeoA
VPGTIISRELESFTGDPIAYNIRGTIIALRNDQAKHILIEKNREAN